MKTISKRISSVRTVLHSLMVITLLIGLGWFQPRQVSASPTDTAFEVYYVPLPDDWLMQHMEDVDTDGGTVGDPFPPVRSVIGISISATNTVVYYDQWEDGGYDVDIANPTNIYSGSNLSGTQIWGDGILSNGCAPRLRDTVNPCTLPSHDVLHAGDVIVLDNLVPITASGGGNHGPWYRTSPAYSGRNASQIRYDGKDKFAASFPVSATRAGWSEGMNGSVAAAGPMFSDATTLEPTKRWGTNFVVPVGTNTTGFGAGSDMNYAHLTIQAQQDGTTVCVDVPPYTAGCNGTGDSTTTINQGQQYDPTPMPNTASPQGVPHGTEVRTNYPVQVIEITGDVGSTWATRWYNLKPRNQWSSDYYQPVGSATAATGVWVYNPNSSSITVSYTFSGSSGSAPCTANTACKIVDIPVGSGARFYTSNGSVFYAVSVTETSGAQLYDWGFSLLPSTQLSDQLLVGWAPGCATINSATECFDVVGPLTANDQVISRSPVWVTPLANTTIYVDLDGQGITCPGGAGAERSIAATALTSYTIVDDPAGSVCDAFEAQSYSDNYCNNNFGANWVETGDTASPASGAIQINDTAGNLRFMNIAGSEAGRTISRARSLAGQSIAQLKFTIGHSGLDATDDLAVEVYNGSSWTTLETFDAPTLSSNPTERVYNLAAGFMVAGFQVRFRIVDDLETNDYWYVDNLSISFGTQPWDFDMSGARLATCDSTKLAAAWGQQPSLSYSGDDQGLDMGTSLFPMGSNITLIKSVDRTWVTPGGAVVYTYEVRTTGSLPLSNVSVTDNYCAPAVYSSGDTNSNNLLESGEAWIFTCNANIYVDTINTASAAGSPDNGSSYIISTPDQERVRVTGAIGDYVWVDEDGDGDQDAGEPGIPNVRLTLTGTDFEGNPVTRTVYTDASGRYVFPDLPPSGAAGYTITVDPASMPAGLAANPTYDENGIGTPHTSTVVLGSGVEHMTADFGYNWSTPTETNNPPSGATGAIGDRLWVDADGDGLQDPNEIGLPGVTVQLITAGPDGIFGTADDVVSATTTTDQNGNYIFDNLPPGAYEVLIPTPPAGYTQTGDPDGTLDNQTSDPIVLAPGDVYLNADFGYQPPAGTTGSIGDRVWLDADGDGVQDAGENGIPGVSVSLIKDLNGNGVWDPGEPIIATDVTDENGIYGFSGLPTTDGAGTDDYLVWVNDSANVLNELAPTYDLDGAGPATGVVSGLGITAVQNLTPAGVNNVDFGYAPPGHTPGEGLIGDTIFLDRDGDNSFDPGEGLEGVMVNLRDSQGRIIARTVTDENGNYSFGNLPAGTYTVEVVTSSLPNAGGGLTNTVDPDGGTPNRSTVTIGGAQPLVNLDQDFGYRPATPNSVGGTIWNDQDADGTQDPSETEVYPGVTVALYEDTNGDGILGEGDRLIGTTTTDSNGHYVFTGLPDGNYLVDVTDEANLLDGYWHSLGTQGEADDGQSKVDPYPINLSGGENRDTVDFGYFRDPAALGNRVWLDLDADGIQDPGENGVPGATVTLTITYPNGVVTTIKTVTDANGFYSFENLLMDEDHDGAGSGEPTYTISVAAPNQFWLPSPAGVGSDRSVDSGLSTGETVQAIRGSYVDTFDFGFYYPTAVITTFDVRFDAALDAFVLDWVTENESDIQGYRLIRTEELSGEQVELASIPAVYIDPVYVYEDHSYLPGVSYVYSLEVIGLDNAVHNTITLPAVKQYKVYAPAISR